MSDLGRVPAGALAPGLDFTTRDVTVWPSIYSAYSFISSLSPGMNLPCFFSCRVLATFNPGSCKIVCLWKQLLLCFSWRATVREVSLLDIISFASRSVDVLWERHVWFNSFHMFAPDNNETCDPWRQAVFFTKVTLPPFTGGCFLNWTCEESCQEAVERIVPCLFWLLCVCSSVIDGWTRLLVTPNGNN